MMRGALAQLRYRLSGADHRQMEKLRAQACAACQGWPADRVTEIVTRYLKDLILPYVYAEARVLLGEHRSAGQDVIIVSTSGQEVVAPIGALLGAESVIATRMRIANGHYTGEMECYAYGEEKAVQVRRLAAERGYSLPGCYAYSDSVTDLPLLEAVGAAAGGQPRPRTSPDRHGTRVARALVQHRRAARRAARGNGSAVINQDHQLVPRSIYAARPIRRRKVLRTYASGHGNRAPTRDQPREASQGSRPQRIGTGLRCPPWRAARHSECALGNPGLTCQRRRSSGSAVRLPGVLWPRQPSSSTCALPGRTMMIP